MNNLQLEEVRIEYAVLKKTQEENLKHFKKIEERVEKAKSNKAKSHLKYFGTSYIEKPEWLLIGQAFNLVGSRYNNFKDTSNKIMVYMGTYRKNGNEYCSTYDNDEMASYRVYKDLETQEVFNILMDDYKQFEDKYLIINVSIPFCNQELYMKNYNELQKWFQKQLINRSQEDVISELREKCEINRKTSYGNFDKKILTHYKKI
jgi:hypothetical protein